MPALATTGKLARLLTLVVDERHRRRGVGRALVAAAEERALALGALALEVGSGSHRDFFQRLGYEDTCAAKARFSKSL